MAKVCKSQDRLTESEWDSLPISLDSPTVARALGVGNRFVQDHGAELGGRKVAGKWLFSKRAVADLLGLEG